MCPGGEQLLRTEGAERWPTKMGIVKLVPPQRDVRREPRLRVGLRRSRMQASLDRRPVRGRRAPVRQKIWREGLDEEGPVLPGFGCGRAGRVNCRAVRVV